MLGLGLGLDLTNGRPGEVTPPPGATFRVTVEDNRRTTSSGDSRITTP